MNKKTSDECLKKMVTLALVLGTSAMLNVAFAEETPSYDLDTVVVTATKVKQAIKDVPASVTVVTAKDIEKMNVKTVDEALRESAGVFASRSKGLTGTTAAVGLRGFSGSGETMVLLDGQPLNQAYAGSVNWSAVPIQSIERIEIVRGAASALYGSQAMGGVINIITKNPEKQEVRVSTKYESFNTKINQLDISDKVNDKFSYQIGYEKKTSDGYATDRVTKSSVPSGYTGYETTTNTKGTSKVYIVGDKGKNTWDENIFHSKFNYKLDDSRNLSFGFQHDKYKYGYSAGHNYLTNSSTGAAYSGYSFSTFLGLPGGRETNIYTFGYRDKNAGVTFNAGLTDVLHSWYISSVVGAATSTGGTGVLSDTPSTRWNFDVQKELSLNPNDQMVFGVNYKLDWIHNREFALSNWINTGSKTGVNVEAEGKSQTLGLFVQDEHKLNDKWRLTLGGRYDSWKNQDKMNNGNDRDDAAFSPKLGLTYKQDETSQLYMSVGKAFTAPDMYKMYRTWTSTTGNTQTVYNGNPDLKAEKVTSSEIGWKKQLDKKTNMTLSCFYNDVTNMVFLRDVSSSTTGGITTNIKKYDNAEKGRTKGFEWELKHTISPAWTGFINYTYQDATIVKYSAKPSIEGKKVTGIPEQMFNIGLDYKQDKLSGNIYGNYVSKRYSSDDNSDTANNVPTSYDPYFIVNTNLNYQFDSKTSVTFGVNNLFDRNYYSYYVAPGRSYSLEVTYKF